MCRHSQTRLFSRWPAALTALLTSATLSYIVAPAGAASPVKFVVLRENGVGTAAQAQPHLDKLLNIAAKKNGWAGASGKYLTRRDRAVSFIESDKPAFGILSLGAYVALAKKQDLDVIGQVDSSNAGGKQYFIISKSKKSLAECKKGKLASDHLGDKRFIDAVVAKGAFKLGEFDLEETRRPVQTVKTVIRDKADCALVDDAQMESLPHVSGGTKLDTVWKSAQLPGMAVVAFDKAPEAQVKSFKASLPSLCSGEGASVCKSVGIRALKPASDATYKSELSAYAK